MIINPRLRGSLRHYKTRTPWCPPTISLSTLRRHFRMCRGSGEATPFLHFPPCPSSAPGHRRRLCTWQMTTGGRLVFSFSFICLFVDFVVYFSFRCLLIDFTAGENTDSVSFSVLLCLVCWSLLASLFLPH